jgi:hypothetical protein
MDAGTHALCLAGCRTRERKRERERQTERERERERDKPTTNRKGRLITYSRICGRSNDGKKDTEMVRTIEVMRGRRRLKLSYMTTPYK